MKTALITGASKRLGAAIAVHLAERGYFVWIHYHSEQQAAEDLCDAIRRRSGNAAAVPADLSREDAIRRMFETISADGGTCELLINNASVFIPGKVDETSFDDWNRIMDVNLRAPWFCSVLAAPLMKKSGKGLIVNVVDSGATKLWTKYAVYGISKQALLRLTQILAKTLGPDIRVNSISPGLILPSADTSAEEWKRLVGKTPLQKEGSPADLLRALDFVLDSEYLTGADIVMDGGYRLVS